MTTDLTGHTGSLTAEDGAWLPVQYALLSQEDAISGEYPSEVTALVIGAVVSSLCL